MTNQTKELLKAYFVFSRRERRALLVLCFTIAILFLISRFSAEWITGDDTPLDELVSFQLHTIKRENDRVNSSEDAEYLPSESLHKELQHTNASNPTRFFAFDPNTAAVSDWEKLGVKASVIQTILKYKAKGGVFRKPEDLQRIFGLSPQLCEKLIPFVRIPEQIILVPKKEPDELKLKKKELQININEATVEDWKMLDGIGPGYAQRILNFREKLGGFYSIEQIAETYGLPDSVFRKIKPKLTMRNGPYKLIKLNEADEEELRKHPYIDYRTAQNIVSYRKQHGFFESVTNLKNIVSMAPEVLEKITPYLALK